MTNPKTPLVSVCMITFNHANYIAQAIESVLMQKVNFPIEIVVGEDASTDNTQTVLQSYVNSYPNTIRPLYRAKNMGIKPNLVDTLLQCKGKYIALLEGDDYWIDSYKLQKQIDFLEDNPDYVLVGGNAITVQEDGRLSKMYLAHNQLTSFDFDTSDLMMHNPLVTLTAVFRNHLVKEFPPVYFQGRGGDRRLYILVSLHGKCRFSNEVMGVYRRHVGGATQYLDTKTGPIESCEEQIKNAERWNKYLKGQYSREVEFVRKREARKLVRLLLRSFKLGKAVRYSRWLDSSDIDTRVGKIIFQILQLFAHFDSKTAIFKE